MDGRSDFDTKEASRALWRTARRRVAAGLTLGLVVLQGPGAACASPIRRHDLIVVTDAQSLGADWARFLAGGPSLWAVTKPPVFPSGLVLPTTLGIPVETPFVDYLVWRRSLNSVRFDLEHPTLGPELSRFVSTPAASPRPFNPAPQNLPEPGTLTVALVLSAAGLGWSRRTRGRASVAAR